MRRILMLGVLVAGTLVIAGAPAHAQEASTTSTSTTVHASVYDDDWYHAYYCWIVARYGGTWNLGTSYDCDGASAAATTLAPGTDAVVSFLGSTAAAVVANANSWVTLNWTVIGGSVDFFQVTATADKGVSAAYPDSTRSFTSLHGDGHLANLELDYTALKLTVPAGVTGDVTVWLHLTYQTALHDKEADYTVTVPVATP